METRMALCASYVSAPFDLVEMPLSTSYLSDVNMLYVYRRCGTGYSPLSVVVPNAYSCSR